MTMGIKTRLGTFRWKEEGFCQPGNIVISNTGQWRIQDFPYGASTSSGGIDSRGGYILTILYVETKESGPLGGHAPSSPHRSTNAGGNKQCYPSSISNVRKLSISQHILLSIRSKLRAKIIYFILFYFILELNTVALILYE